MRFRTPTLALVACGGLLAMGAAAVAPAAAAPHPEAVTPHATGVHRVLFDDTKAETAGNADWIISTSMPDPTKQNAAPVNETDWTGALSSWGVALQRTGQYQLDTLPPGNTITFGTANALDLSNFDVLVLPEPNVLLSAAEKTAVMKFVQAGGGLFFITDHTGSDRNNDGADAVDIANDLMTNNSVDSTDPFGFSVDLKDIASDHPVPISAPSNPVLNGPFGVVKHSLIADGTTFTLKPADNPNVAGLLHLSTSAAGNTNNTFVTSTFGLGRVAFWDDSSPIDDGTGQAGNTLFVGWADPTADNAALGLNATQWLAQGSSGAAGVAVTSPGAQSFAVGRAVSLPINAVDGAGGTLTYTATGLPAGLTISATTGVVSGTPTTSASGTATITATDTGGTSGTAMFAWTVGAAGTGCPAAQLLGNPGFENGSAPWSATTGVIFSSAKEPAHTGSFVGWLDGRGVTTTDTLSQPVSIPATCTAATFSFWLHIDTAEPATSAFDTFKVQVLGSAGTVLSTLATFSNENAVTGYLQHSFNLASFAGQTVTLKFTGAEDFEKQTSFVVDDTALNVS